MNKDFKRIIGLLNTIDEIVDYLINNGVNNHKYLLDDIVAGIDICENMIGKKITESEKEKMILKSSEIKKCIVILKEDLESANIEPFVGFISIWSDYIIDINIKIRYLKENLTEDENVYTINTDNYPLPKEGNDIYESRENFSSIARRGEDQPLVSIIVVSYDRLEKTKQCIESVIKYTNDVDYELVLVDNGSGPEILSYYKSIEFKYKKILRITKNMQLSYGIFKGTKLCNGKYIALLGNDIVVTKNWMTNIIKCFNSDIRIGMVCAMSSNISNLQQVNYNFKNLEDVHMFAENFNVSDKRKWHERLRLITAGAVYKAECIDISGDWDYGFFHDFADDDLSFHIRRAGYKTVLCKDVFVHHDHIIGTDKNDGELIKSLEKGRENFKKKYYGIDAWDDVNNFELIMQSMIKSPIRTDNLKILGVDVKCGTPILEMKNNLRSNGIFDVKLSAHYRDGKYTIDLNTICDEKVICDREEHLLQNFYNEKFDYILLGETINSYKNPRNMINDLLILLRTGGQLILKIRNDRSLVDFLDVMDISKANKHEYINKFCLDDLKSTVEDQDIKIDKIEREYYNIDDSTLNTLKKSIGKMGLNRSVEKIMDRFIISNYVVSIVKSI